MLTNRITERGNGQIILIKWTLLYTEQESTDQPGVEQGQAHEWISEYIRMLKNAANKYPNIFKG